jgi:3-phenylpropionate/trans-cinnamate dioxygenase ferredoxin subunit
VAERALGRISDDDLAALAPGRMTTCQLGDTKVLLCNVGGVFYAVEDRCSHAAVPLSRGSLDGFEVECPFHGARFDVRSGRALCPPAREPIAVFDVETSAGGVEIRSR